MAKKTSDSFKFVGNYDVSPFIEKLPVLDWEAYVERQQIRYGMHDTFTIPLIWDPDLVKLNVWPQHEIFAPQINELQQLMTKLLGNGQMYTCVLTKLVAHKEISFHNDYGNFFKNTNRIHIPIQTSEEVIFVVGEQKLNMKVGEMWEINNYQKVHGVFNNGDIDRIHLMVDWLPEGSPHLD